jgi:putative (di)nucleoside polyphosphate hydrolase
LWKNAKDYCYAQNSGPQVIDSEGYRANVGIIISNAEGRVLWCRRVGQDAWQFPQGGIEAHETPEQALYRELREETGLQPEHVSVLASTRQWLKYHLPEHLIRQECGRKCIGQKQKWFLLRLKSKESALNLDRASKPEFDDWRWVDYWYPVSAVIFFKRDVYEQALTELEPALGKEPGVSPG